MPRKMPLSLPKGPILLSISVLGSLIMGPPNSPGAKNLGDQHQLHRLSHRPTIHPHLAELGHPKQV